MTIQSTPLLEEAKILALLREQGHPSVADWKVKVGEDSFDYPASGYGSSLKPSRSLSSGMQSVTRCGSGLPREEMTAGSMYDSAPKRNRATWMPQSARKPLRTPGRRQHEPCCRPAAAGKDLLAQDPRKPRQVNLRRAVSTGIMPRKRVLSLSISIST